MGFLFLCSSWTPVCTQAKKKKSISTQLAHTAYNTNSHSDTPDNNELTLLLLDSFFFFFSLWSSWKPGSPQQLMVYKLACLLFLQETHHQFWTATLVLNLWDYSLVSSFLYPLTVSFQDEQTTNKNHFSSVKAPVLPLPTTKPNWCVTCNSLMLCSITMWPWVLETSLQHTEYIINKKSKCSTDPCSPNLLDFFAIITLTKSTITIDWVTSGHFTSDCTRPGILVTL